MRIFEASAAVAIAVEIIHAAAKKGSIPEERKMDERSVRKKRKLTHLQHSRKMEKTERKNSRALENALAPRELN